MSSCAVLGIPRLEMLGEPARFFGKIRPAPRSTQLLHTPPAYHHYEDLTLIRQASSTAETAYGLVQEFLTMVRKRQGEQLDSWIEAVQTSHIPELHRFVAGILKDKDAVVAGLTQIYSNGPVEAQVQKLKPLCALPASPLHTSSFNSSKQYQLKSVRKALRFAFMPRLILLVTSI